MDIKQVLQMLQSVSGPNASGEYTARCPAHDDKTASLTVREKASEKDGKTRIYLCCHAGCKNDRIMQVLGIRPVDLIVNPDQGYPRGAPRRPAPKAPEKAPEAQGVTVHEAGNAREAFKDAAQKSAAPKIDLAHPDRVYSYTDEGGNELFQVCRYQYTEDGKNQKTFRQRIHDPQNPNARNGYVWSVPPEIRDTTLYRMPNVAKAIREGKPVFVVEGEKDVETLERLGKTATCNPGGAGKWRDGYSQRLKDADVIILPDSDTKDNGYTGQNHALDVALKLQGIAKRVRLIDIKAACPDLPPKGDISDMVAIMGDVKAMDALTRQMAATGDFDPAAVPFWLSPEEQAERLYSAVRGYGVMNGCIVQHTGQEIKPLCDFVVLPRMELEKDDGQTTEKFFVMDGWSRKGKKLKRVQIPAGELDGMNWVTQNWGFDAALVPGSTTKQKVSWAIKQVGQMTAKRLTEYTHTGWRKIGGKYAYLYHGGAVGMDGVTVDMGNVLSTYRLDGNGQPGFDEITPEDAAAASLRLKDVMKADVGIPLLGTMYLAPLREFLAQTDIVPAFALYLHGSTGTHKTTAASLALSHFGNFHAKNPPASFNDTANQIRAKAFYVKDMPILVDDFHPTKSIQEKRQMSATAQGLSRAFGDGSDRGRLNADSTIKNNRPPRSIAVITGEDLPDIGASGLARFFVVDIEKGDIPVGKDLTDLQELARKGALQKAMRGYIEWLLERTDTLPETLHGLFLHYRESVRAESDGQHDRAPEAVACIMIGYTMMINYLRDKGLIDTYAGVDLLKEAKRALIQTSAKQARDLASEKPSRIFLDGMAELLNGRQAAVMDLTSDKIKDPPANERMVGYVDSEYYYLLPNVAFGAVQRLCREQGTEFPVSLKGLYKELKADGIVSDPPTKGKWLNGKTLRLLWIPAGAINGPGASVAQVKAVEVTGEQLPFDE